MHRPWIAVLVTTLGLRLLVFYSQPLLKELPTGVFAVACVFAGGPFLVWQIVGALRSARRYLLSAADIVALWASYFVVLVVFVLAVVQSIDGYFAVLRHGDEQSRLALRADKPTLPVSEDGMVVYLSGEMNFAMNSALINTLAAYPGIERAMLASEGGLVFAARAIALNISRQRIDTHVDEICNSACTIAFIGGQRRTLAAGGKLGFHRYRMGISNSPVNIDIDMELEKERRFFERQGVSADFVARVFDAGHDAIWYPGPDELAAAGVITTGTP